MGNTRTTLITLPLLVAVALAVAGCGTQRVGDAAGSPGPSHPTPSGVTTPNTPNTPTDFPCPGESPKSKAPAPAASPSSTVPPTDHYAENHGFRVAIPLHGQSRCDGLSAAGRARAALEPLRRRGDFTPESARDALTRLGYSSGRVQTHEAGPTGVGFLIDIGASPWCVEGTMTSASTTAEAFAGYPDGTGCEPPRGGH